MSCAYSGASGAAEIAKTSKASASPRHARCGGIAFSAVKDLLGY
jgi:hypothetical protein